MPTQVGQVINNKYRLLRHIGDGGMGSVYEARHETLGTTVALKFLHLEFSRREGLVQRFLQEARASAQIQSPHVVRVSDVDQTPQGDVYIVLEYLEGKTLQALYEELYKAGRRLSYPEGLDYAVQILEGVEAAHKAGIVHRDLKPDNVMIATDPKGGTLLKLLDFGIAKLKVIGGKPGLTRPGVMMGTPEYMAPEQATSADTVDVRADIFSLGVIIFEMLAGQRPVGGDDPHEIAAAYMSGRISRIADLVPGIAPELADAVHRAIAPLPQGRFSSVAEMREAFESFASAVRTPSMSRLRAGGTIGVSIPGAEASAQAQAPAAPPPPAGRAPVAKTWPPDDDGGGQSGVRPAGTMIDDAPAPNARGTFVGGGGGGQGSSTHRMNQPYVAPHIGVSALPPAPAGRRRRRDNTPWIAVGGVVAIGLLIAGIVAASRSSSSKEKDEDPPTQSANPPAQATVAQQPGPQTDPPPQTPVQPGTAPVPAPVPQKPGGPRPTKPAPSGSAQPSTPPPGSPFVLPSTLPFPNPFQPAPQPQPAPQGGGSSKPQDPPPPLFPGL